MYFSAFAHQGLGGGPEGNVLRQIDEVEQLVLDECHFKTFTPVLKKELEKYKNLLYLSLNDC